MEQKTNKEKINMLPVIIPIVIYGGKVHGIKSFL